MEDNKSTEEINIFINEKISVVSQYRQENPKIMKELLDNKSICEKLKFLYKIFHRRRFIFKR